MKSAIDSQMVELEKASRRSAMFGGMGLSVATLSVAIATGLLHRATTQVTLIAQEVSGMRTELESEQKVVSEAESKRRLAQLEAEDLDADMKTKTDELTRAAERLDEIQRAVAESGPPALVTRVQTVARGAPRAARHRTSALPLVEAAQVQLSATPTTEKVGMHWLYDIRMWVELPAALIDNVFKVDYVFEQPRSSPKTKTSFDPSDHFAIHYRGSGCTEQVKVVLFERGGQQNELFYRMCDAPAWRAVNNRDLPHHDSE
ncbi:MAG TPA: hypothetical protein VK550_19175 [Polyangiaceae bacterium]|nr:hypothetical protein [Polyangiaceae bacterium]